MKTYHKNDHPLMCRVCAERFYKLILFKYDANYDLISVGPDWAHHALHVNVLKQNQIYFDHVKIHGRS